MGGFGDNFTDTVVESGKQAMDASANLLDEALEYTQELQAEMANRNFKTGEGAMISTDAQARPEHVTGADLSQVDITYEGDDIKRLSIASQHGNFDIVRHANGEYNGRDGEGNFFTLDGAPEVDGATGDVTFRLEDGTKVQQLANGARMVTDGDQFRLKISQADGSQWELRYYANARFPDLPHQVTTPEGDTWIMSNLAHGELINLYIDPSAPSVSHYGNEAIDSFGVSARGDVSFRPLDSFVAPDGSLLQVLEPYIVTKLNEDNKTVVCRADGTKATMP